MKRASSRFGKKVVKLGGGGVFDFTTGELSSSFSQSSTPMPDLSAGAVKIDSGASSIASGLQSQGAELMNPGGTAVTLDNPGTSVAADQLAAGAGAKKGMSGGTAAAIGTGISMLGNTFANNGPKMLDPNKANARSKDALDSYNNTVAKSQKRKAAVTGTMDAVGTGLMMVPGGQVGGLAALGVSAVVKALPWGKKKAEDAKRKFEFQQQTGEQEITTRNANIMKNSIGKPTTYEYGSTLLAKKGLKLGRSFYEDKAPGKRNSVKKSKSKFAKK